MRYLSAAILSKVSVALLSYPTTKNHATDCSRDLCSSSILNSLLLLCLQELRDPVTKWIKVQCKVHMFCHVRKGWHFPIFLLNGWGWGLPPPHPTTTRCNSKEIPHDEKATKKKEIAICKKYAANILAQVFTSYTLLSAHSVNSLSQPINRP